MLNPSLVQKHLSTKYTSQVAQKFWLTILCKYIKRKNKYNRITGTDDCLVTSHSTICWHLTVSEISSLQLNFILKLNARYGPGGLKTECQIRYFLSFETENWICWLLRHYLNFLCELNFIGQQIFNVSPSTRNCPNLHTHETHQPNLTYIQVVLKF